MKVMFCWRCQMDIPMLDEDEFNIIEKLHPAYWTLEQIKDDPRGRFERRSFEDRLLQVTEKYREITGFEETNVSAIMHHRISLYGPDCKSCGKPLRSPKAAFCAGCGATVKDN